MNNWATFFKKTEEKNIIEFDYKRDLSKYASHLPMLNSVILFFGIDKVIECGSGLFSTSFLAENVEHLISIEHDESFYKIIKNNVAFSDKQKYILILVNNEIIGNHGSLFSENLDYKCLFIDAINGSLRSDILMNFNKFFDIIIFHDCEQANTCYDAFFKECSLSDFFLFIDRPTNNPHTGCLVKKEIFEKKNLDINVFFKVLENESNKYWMLFDDHKVDIVDMGSDDLIDKTFKECHYDINRKNHVDVSIVISCYNYAYLLYWCLYSIKKQKTNFSYEIIVVDDGSEEDIESTCSKFSDVRYFRLDKNNIKHRNKCVAANFGIFKANGEIILEVGRDIYMVDDDFIEKMVKTANVAEKKVCYPNFFKDDYGLFLTRLNEGRFEYECFEELPSLINKTLGFSYAYKKSIAVDIGGYDEDFGNGRSYDDNNFYERLLLSGCNFVGVDCRAVHLYHERIGDPETENINFILYSKKKEDGNIMSDNSIFLRYSNVYENKLTKKHKNNICVYTTVFGETDNLKDPHVVSEDIDYICFTENRNIKSNVWEIIYCDLKYKDNSQLSTREYKINPHKYLKEYDISVWIDAAYQIRLDFKDIIEKALDGYSLAAYKHSGGNNIYQEFDGQKNPKYNRDLMKKQIEKYKNIKKYDFESFIILQSGILFRRHNEKDCILFSNYWFNEIINFGCECQISMPYALFESKIKYNKIEPDTPKGFWDHGWCYLTNVLPNMQITNNNKKYKIYDCFPFNNEFDVLEIRLNELYDTVDHFVIVEATKTHMGKDKPLYFQENKSRFSKFSDKIIHIVVNDMPENVEDPWIRERFQRDAIMRGLEKCDDLDIICISDADEIPRASKVSEYTNKNEIVCLEQKLYYYKLNCVAEDKWKWFKILPYGKLKEMSPCGARYYQNCTIVANGGWHFSYLGDPDSIIRKIESNAHHEYNNDHFKNKKAIKNKIENGEDLFERGLKYKYVNIDNSYPKYILDNIEKFKNNIKEIEKINTETKENQYVMNVLSNVKGFFSYEDAMVYRKLAEKVVNGTIVEVGSYLGASTLCIADICKKNNNKIYCVDTWKGSPEHQEGEDFCIHPPDRLYEDFIKNIKNSGYEDIIIPIKESSVEVSKILKENGVNADIVFIDANHSYVSVCEDIDCWKKFVKPNGFLCGHDIYSYEVKRAVNEKINKYKTEGNIWIKEIKKMEKIEITVSISTKDRYETTLPLCLCSIANQTYLPKRILIFDDSEKPKYLTENPLYFHIFSLFEKKGINWEVIFGEKMGQVKNHQKTLQIANTEWIFRLDDDCVMESNVLEKLIDNIDEKTGAVGCLVLDPKNDLLAPENFSHNKIEDISSKPNIQWFRHDGVKKVEHLYSSFLFRKQAGDHGYCTYLSPAGHREETLFTYEMFKKGWNLIVDPGATIWHFRSPTGGIRSFQDASYWERDNLFFEEKIKILNNKIIEKKKMIVLDLGMGDHFDFASLLREYTYMHNDLIIACCYPEVLSDFKIELTSIAHAKMVFNNIDHLNVYGWAQARKWKKSIIEAFRQLYFSDKKQEKTNIEYKSIYNENSKEIVISPFAREMRNKKQNPKNYPWWNNLVKELQSKGFSVTQIGVQGEESIGANRMLLNLSIEELKKIITDCFLWISVDNFMGHFGSYIGRPGIVIWGKSDPLIFGNEKNINILKDRKYLRNDQFGLWESEEFDESVFMKPEEILGDCITS